MAYDCVNRKNYKVCFEGSSGLEKFNSLPPSELRADGYFIVINPLQDENLEEKIKFWLY